MTPDSFDMREGGNPEIVTNGDMGGGGGPKIAIFAVTSFLNGRKPVSIGTKLIYQ